MLNKTNYVQRICRSDKSRNRVSTRLLHCTLKHSLRLSDVPLPNGWQTRNHFCIIGILSDDVFAGFISYWDFEDFIYIEHFATSKSLRGNGIGGKAIDTFKQSCQGKPVVLEVEMPTDDISKRRIAFYNKHGFTLSELPYMQPAYRPCDAPIELRIMSTDPVFTTKGFDKVTGTIHRHVYGVKVK